MNKKDKTIKEILLDHGFIVTNKKFGGWDNGNRMITDLNGNEIAFIPPNKVLEKLCPDYKNIK